MKMQRSKIRKKNEDGNMKQMKEIRKCEVTVKFELVIGKGHV